MITLRGEIYSFMEVVAHFLFAYPSLYCWFCYPGMLISKSYNIISWEKSWKLWHIFTVAFQSFCLICTAVLFFLMICWFVQLKYSFADITDLKSILWMSMNCIV